MTSEGDGNDDNKSGFKVNNEFFDKIRQDSRNEEKELLESREVEEPSIPDYSNLGAIEGKTLEVLQEKPTRNDKDVSPAIETDEELPKTEPEYLNAVNLSS